MKSPLVISTIDIPTILNQIKTGTYKVKILESRTYGKGHPIFEQNKTEIPTFTPNGTFNLRRSVNHLQSLNGLIYLDIDHETDIKKIQNLSCIYSYWKSISDIGYGVLVSVSGLTKHNFKLSWLYLETYFSEIDITIDPHTKDISRQCVISYDPLIYINPEVIPLIIPVTDKTSEGLYPPLTTTLPDYQSNMTYTDKIKYQTTLDDYGNSDYVVIEDGKSFRNTYVPKIIYEGKRHYWLCSYTSSLLFNNPTITCATLEKFVYKVNQEHCHPKLTKEEVHSLIVWSFRKHRNQELHIKTKKKKIWINPEKKFTTKQKRKIIGQAIGKLRRKRTINILISIYKELSIQNQRVTQKLLEDNSNMNIRTIKKYWNEICNGEFLK